MYQLLAAVLIGVVVGVVGGVVGVHWAVSGVVAFIVSLCFNKPIGDWLEKINKKENSNG